MPNNRDCRRAPVAQLQGIVVNEVSPDGPAANAGIQVNDLIISVDNKPAISALETMDQVAEIRPGSVIPVVVMRDDKQLTLQVTIQDSCIITSSARQYPRFSPVNRI